MSRYNKEIRNTHADAFVTSYPKIRLINNEKSWMWSQKCPN